MEAEVGDGGEWQCSGASVGGAVGDELDDGESGRRTGSTPAEAEAATLGPGSTARRWRRSGSRARRRRRQVAAALGLLGAVRRRRRRREEDGAQWRGGPSESRTRRRDETRSGGGDR